jgi:tetratricopeptide (TPR) repeat protein
MRPTLAALVLLFALKAQAQGWQELKTPHFTLRTDLDPRDAMRAAVEIERTRAALLTAMWPQAQDVGVEPLDVIVLANSLDFERYAGRGSKGIYTHAALPPRILLSGTPEQWEVRFTGPEWLDVRTRGTTSAVLRYEIQAHLAQVRAGSSSVLRHELAHHVAAGFYARQPLWFSEGQAQFLESLRLSEDGRTATLGLVNPVAWLEYMNVRSVSTADVLAWSTPGQLADGKTQGLYGASWQLYQWLFTTHRPGLRCYQEAMAAAEDPAQAWKRCFPDLVPSEVDPALWEFVRRGTPATVEISVPPQGLRVDGRPMTDAEVHLVRTQLALTAAGMGQRPEFFAEAQTELDRALAADPTLVGALVLQAPLLSLGDRLASGRRAVKAHPDDGWAWLLLADALWDTGGPEAERERAYRKAVELLPDSPLVLSRAARNLLTLGQRTEALGWAAHAARLAPWNGEVQATYSLALAAARRCPAAQSVAEQARNALLRKGALLEMLDTGLKRACPNESLDAGVTTGAL